LRGGKGWNSESLKKEKPTGGVKKEKVRAVLHREGVEKM